MKPSHLTRWTWILGFASLIVVGCAGGAPTTGGDDDGSGEPPPKVKQPPNPKDGSSTAPNCDGIPEHGTCQDGVAVSCDVAGDALRRKDCKALGKSCVVDGTRGAVCDTVAPQSGGGTSTCDSGVTFEGTCGGASGQTAVWCDPESNQTISWNCADDGKTCEENLCALGAFCCGTGTPPPPPPPTSVCPALGFAGKCESATKAVWCNGPTVVEKQCTGVQTCQVDACADGAYCCNPPTPVPSECDTIGVRGVCNAGKPRWCSSGTVQEVTCATGKTCQIDVCGDGAFCCSP